METEQVRKTFMDITDNLIDALVIIPASDKRKPIIQERIDTIKYCQRVLNNCCNDPVKEQAINKLSCMNAAQVGMHG